MEKADRLTTALTVERIAMGAFLGLAPGPALQTFSAPEGSNTPTVRYLARIFAVRNVVLGLLLWDARQDRKRLHRLATFNAATEVTDAVAAVAPLARHRDQGLVRAALSSSTASLSVAAAFIALRTATLPRRKRWGRG